MPGIEGQGEIFRAMHDALQGIKGSGESSCLPKWT